MKRAIRKKDDVKVAIDELKGSMNIIAISFGILAVLLALSLNASSFIRDILVYTSLVYCLVASIYLLIESRAIRD